MLAFKGTNVEGVKASMRLIHDDLKEIIMLCKEFIGQNNLCIYGTLALPHITKEQLNIVTDCDNCVKRIKYITSEDLQSLDTLRLWWKNLNRDVYQCMKGNSPNYSWFSNLVSQFMVLLASEQDDLPVVCGDADTKIRSLILNPDQVNAIYHSDKQKFIRG